MVVGEMPDAVDLLVVGGGPGGYVAALAGAAEGRQVVLVDALGEAGLGGVCVNVGCIPSKALIEMANGAHSISSWTGRGFKVDAVPRVEMGDFQAWKGEMVGVLNDGVRQLLRSAGVEVRQGYFRFTRPNQGVLEYGDGPPMHIQFESCIVAAGSRPNVLPHLTPDGVRIVDSSDVLSLKHLPGRVVVVGAGYIGVELGTALLKLGAEITIVEMADRLLPTLPQAVAAPVARRVRQLGMDVRTGTQVVGDDGRAVTVRNSNGEDTVEADLVVVAVGRVPNTDDLGLDALGIKPDKAGLLEVGPDRLLTSHVAAIGDITAGPALAHKASAEAHVAVEVLSGRRAAFDPLAIPAVVFSDPEVAVTGLAIEEAHAAGISAAVATFPLTASGRARTLNGVVGFTQLVHTVEDGIVIGAQLVGPHASDCVTEASLAIEMGANLVDVARTIHPHPTMSETVMEAAQVGEGRPVHVAARRR